eukprot:scaffold93756_cov33-Phaeocystis_antarctica.AAC.1
MKRPSPLGRASNFLSSLRVAQALLRVAQHLINGDATARPDLRITLMFITDALLTGRHGRLGHQSFSLRLKPLVGVGPRACDTLNGQRLGAKRRACSSEQAAERGRPWAQTISGPLLIAPGLCSGSTFASFGERDQTGDEHEAIGGASCSEATVLSEAGHLIILFARDGPVGQH